MSQPLLEYEAKFTKSLKQTTGKDYREWLSLIETSGVVNKRTIRDWLQKEHGLDYLLAHKLSFLYMEDQKLNGPKVLFSGNLRSGKVEYKSKAGSFVMDSEMGAYDVLAIIAVPSTERWESETGIPLTARESVLHFIGRKTVEKQTWGSGSYEIRGNYIKIKS